MNKNLFSLLFCVFFVAGCQQNLVSSEDNPSKENPVLEKDTVTAETTEEKTHVEEISGDKNKIITKELTASEKITLSLVRRGEQAFAAQHFLIPEDDNANLYFQAALGREPGNFRATQGIANIVEIYTDWAWSAARKRGYKTADRYLDFARLANPEDPLIAEIKGRINDLKQKRIDDARYKAQQSAKKTANQTNTELLNKTEKSQPKQGVYLLPENLFSLSDEEIVEKIQPIIDEVAKTEQAIAIYWPDDKKARLIYQIINSRVPEFRVRAMTFRRSDHMVELQQD